MGFSRTEYWNGQPFPSPRGLFNPGIKPRSPALPTDSLPTEPQGKPGNTYTTTYTVDSLREFAIWLRELKPGLCDNLEG